MAAGNRDNAISLTLGYEGGYSNHPADPGGPTNYGITIADARRYWKKDATADDVKGMPKGVAIGVYQTRYWAPIRGDALPAGVDFATFDFGVNSGVPRGVKALQRAVRATVDGVVGEATIGAAMAADTVVTVKAICAERLGFLEGLRIWSVFGGGWGRRVADVEARGVKMALDAAKHPDVPGELVKHANDAAKQAKKEVVKAGGTVAAPTVAHQANPFMPPIWLLYVVLGVIAVAVVVFLYRSYVHRQRAAAYAAVAKES